MYKVKDRNGNSLTGFVEAANKREATNSIAAEGYFILEMTPVNKRKTVLIYHVPVESVIRFTQKLHAMLKAGVAILSSLKILWEQTEDKQLQMILSEMITDLGRGMLLSMSLKKYPSVFPPTYINLIEVGERGGDLVGVLQRVIDHLAQERDVVQKVKRALVYPAIVLVVTVIVIVVMLTLVVPVFRNVFEKLNIALPPITQMLLDLSSGFLRYWWVCVILVFAGFLLAGRYRSTHEGRMKIDHLKTRLPLAGGVIRVSALARFIHSLRALVASGININDALIGAERSFGNLYLESKMKVANPLIAKGGRISDSLKETGLFPLFVIQMISIGENSGMLVEMLKILGDFLDEEIDYEIHKLTTALGPTVVVIVGGVVLFVLASIYFPIFTLWSTFGK